MPPAKISLLESRLQKNLKASGCQTFREYCDYLLSNESKGSNDLVSFIDAVTTNKTNFFREPVHYKYLKEYVLPRFVEDNIGIRRKIMIWSAGCSTGEEPYTLAIVLKEFARENALNLQFSILATDLSDRVLNIGKRAIYPEETIEVIPLPLRKLYLIKSKDKNKGLVRIVPELRNLIQFQKLNFMDAKLNVSEKVDIIFCRNVIIYFDRPTQEKLIMKFHQNLNPSGYLFLGHSESIHGMDLPFNPIYPTFFSKIHKD